MLHCVGRMGLPLHTGVRDLTNADGQVLLSNNVVDNASKGMSLAEYWNIDGNIDILDPVSMMGNNDKLSEEAYKQMYNKTSKPKIAHHKVEMASFALPHPYKDAVRGVTENRKALGMDRELCEDNTLNADAHFVMVVPVRNASSSSSQVNSNYELLKINHIGIWCNTLLFGVKGVCLRCRWCWQLGSVWSRCTGFRTPTCEKRETSDSK